MLQSSFLKLRWSTEPPALHLANFCEESQNSQPETGGGTGHSTVSWENKENRETPF